MALLTAKQLHFVMKMTNDQWYVVIGDSPGGLALSDENFEKIVARRVSEPGEKELWEYPV